MIEPDVLAAAVPTAWVGFLDDTAPGAARPGVDLHGASAAHGAVRNGTPDGLLGRLVVHDDVLPLLRGFAHPLHVVLTGGAGQVAGPAAFAARTGLQVAALELVLRDVDDLGANVRRVVAAVDAARDEGKLSEDVAVHLEIPVTAPAAAWGSPDGSWLRAADEVAAAELRLTLRAGGSHTDRFAAPATFAAWINAALDRETPFRVAGARARAITHTATTEDGEATAFGFANALLATRRAFDGADAGAVLEALTTTDPTALGAWLAEEEFLAATRRWLGGWGTTAGTELGAALRTAEADLRALGQLD